MTDETEVHDDAAADVAEAVKKTRGPRKAKDDDDAAADVAVRRVAKVPEAPKFFPVRLLRNYRPINDFRVNGAIPTAEEREKVRAGASVELEIDEARAVISKGIAERNDPIG